MKRCLNNPDDEYYPTYEEKTSSENTIPQNSTHLPLDEIKPLSSSPSEKEIRWRPPRERKPDEKKISSLKRMRNNLEFQEFKDSSFYNNFLDKPWNRDKIAAVYPYYLIDLVAAYEEGGQKGGEEVINGIVRRLKTSSEIISNAIDVK